MKILLLNGHGMRMSVQNACLHIVDGRSSYDTEPETYIFRPKRIDVENVVVYSRNGTVTLDAIRWLIKHNVQVSILDWNGKLLTTMLPRESVQVKTKFAQYRTFENERKRLVIAKKFIEAKFTRTQNILDYLKSRYPEINTDISQETKRLRTARTIPEILMIEGRVASHYWQEYKKAIPKNFEFETREYQKRPRGAGDTMNCLLNYGYAILEAELLRAINSTGLDPHVGFLHQMCQGKNSLAYDLQELFRWLIDLAVLQLLEHNTLQKSDFIRSETYTLRLRPSGAKKLISAIDEQLTKKAIFNGKEWSWRYVLLAKTRELAHYLVGKKKILDFTKPNLVLERDDTEEFRKQILNINYVEWQKLGFSKGTLHYMKQNAKQHKPFTLNNHVKERLLTIR